MSIILKNISIYNNSGSGANSALKPLWDIIYPRKHESVIALISKRIFFSVYFFFALFQPPLLHIKTNIIMLLFNIMIFCGLSVLTGGIKFSRKILGMILGFLPFVLYLVFMQAYHIMMGESDKMKYFILIKINLLMIIYFFVMVLALCRMIDFFHISFKEFMAYIFIAALMQFACVLAAFVVPSIKTLFVNMMIANSNDETIIRAIKKGALYRCYGFAENLFDAFGYILSILISIIMLEGIERKKWVYTISAVFMLFMPLINARTGIILSLVGFAIVLTFYSSPKRLLKILILLPFLILFCKEVFSLLPASTSKWILSGFEETSSLLDSGQTTGVYSEILGKDLVYPDNLLLGAGGSPELLAHYSGIDSGYIQCLWRYGIIGTALLLGAYINMFRMAFFVTKAKKYRCMIIIILIIFVVYLFKLYSLTNYGSVFLIFGIPTFIIKQSINEKEGRNTFA